MTPSITSAAITAIDATISGHDASGTSRRETAPEAGRTNRYPRAIPACSLMCASKTTCAALGSEMRSEPGARAEILAAKAAASGQLAGAS